MRWRHMTGEIDFSTAKGGHAGNSWSLKSADPEYFNGQLSGRAVDAGEYL